MQVALSCDYTGPSVENLSSEAIQELASNLGSGQWSANKLGHTWNRKYLEVKDAYLPTNWQLLCRVRAEPRPGASLQSKRVCLSATCHWHVGIVPHTRYGVWHVTCEKLEPGHVTC